MCHVLNTAATALQSPYGAVVLLSTCIFWLTLYGVTEYYCDLNVVIRFLGV